MNDIKQSIETAINFGKGMDWSMLEVQNPDDPADEYKVDGSDDEVGHVEEPQVEEVEGDPMK